MARRSWGMLALAALMPAGLASAQMHQDTVGPHVAPLWGVPRGAATVLYDNVPVPPETVFTTGSAPRTGGADEVLFDGLGALVTSMQFGYSVAAAGPAAFDAHVRFWDDIDPAAGVGVPQFLNQVGEITIPFTGQTAGAFITAPIDLTGLAGGGVSVTANPVTIGFPNITDFYFQIEFFQPGTTTPVAGNGVTYIFDGSGVNTGYSFASPAVGGNGTATDEVYWRDVNANGIISGDEARNFAAPNRANMVLHFEGEVVPGPGTIALLGLAGLGMARRRR